MQTKKYEKFCKEKVLGYNEKDFSFWFKKHEKFSCSIFR